DKLAVFGWGANLYGRQTTSQLKLISPPKAGQGSFVLRKEINIISSSYDGSFSVFFYACASQSYDAFFSYHKAYSNNFLILFINMFSLF
ncbi:MAG: hypothetical protein ACXWV6_02985, partial [Chitinophagaceae bacterium]